MIKKIIFTILFLISLTGIEIASLSDWFILSLVIHVIWLTMTSNQILRRQKVKYKTDRIFKIFNKVIIYILIADVVIIILSMSFGFRLIFANLYRPTFYLSLICITISVLGNYFIVIDYLTKKTDSLSKKVLLGISSLFYPIGVYILTEN